MPFHPRPAGLTIFLVEQDARQALRGADRALVLVNGRVELEGSGPELAEREAMLAAYLGRTAGTT
jgi:branched-chain amino acid transport system ATP-binding protein